MDALDTVTGHLDKAKRVAVLTGAGISAESGIPTFRDALTGLWERFDAQNLATPEAFLRDKALVWGWYEWRRMKVLSSLPNAGHVALAQLAHRVDECTLITQNVDDLHERSGSTNVLHLHGSLHAPRCFDCGRPHVFPAGIPDEPEGGRRIDPPRCAQCGGNVRPGVVWFGETLPDAVWRAAEHAVRKCDTLLSVGTSGLVYPAAGLLKLAHGLETPVITINPLATNQDRYATYALRGPAGVVLPVLVERLQRLLA